VRPGLGWQLDPSVTFLNHGSFGACPVDILAVQRGWTDRLEREPVRFLDDELAGHLDAARADLGAFLGADPAGIAFVPNATTGVNAVLGSIRFAPGDEILTDDHEYNAILTTVRAAAERDGAQMVVAPIPFPIADPSEAVDAILGAVTARTRLAVISHVTSTTALVLPIERIVAELAARSIDTLVDGAHAPGMVPVEIDRLGAAYYTGNGHKWLCGPKGSAFLWARHDRRHGLRPPITSHGRNDPRTDRSRYLLEFDWMGTFDPTPALSLPAAIDWVARLDPGGWPAVMAANHAAAVAARDRLVDLMSDGAATPANAPAPTAMLGSMGSVILPRLTTDDEAAALHRWLLDEAGIEIPVVGWPVRGARGQPTADPRRVLLRVSTQRYNDDGDIDRLVAALRRRGLAMR
jgi:isopenicillin-N epimerase